MKIVIELPETLYEAIKSIRWMSLGRSNCKNILFKLVNAVKNGTPLPQGHGRLIDVNDLLNDISLEDNDYNRDVNVGEIITLENIDRIPTIIEAESEEE